MTDPVPSAASRTPEDYFICPECGPHVAADEDGLCATCGIQVFRSTDDWYVAALRAAEATGFERCRAAAAEVLERGGPAGCVTDYPAAIRALAPKEPQ